MLLAKIILMQPPEGARLVAVRLEIWERNARLRILFCPKFPERAK